MRGRTGRGRQANRQPVANHLERRFNALEKRLTGSKTVPAINPPAFVQLPWNSWTFERLDKTVTDLELVTVSVNDIITQIKGRLQLSDSADIRIKVQSAQIWVKQAADQYARSTQRDKGTLNMPARCGYMFPSADRREVLGASEVSLNVVAGQATNSGSDLTFRVQVLWQSSISA